MRIAFWDQRLADLDAVISGLEADLADCLDQCDAFEREIDNLVDEHRECLEQLEHQRKAQDEIDRAAGDSQRLDQADDKADDFIDNRSGSPAEAQPDRDAVQEGRDQRDEAEDKIAAGRAKLNEARAKLADGLTEEAELLKDNILSGLRKLFTLIGLLIRFPMAPTILDFELETASAAMVWQAMPSDGYSLTPRPDLGQTEMWTLFELSVPLSKTASAGLFRLRVGRP